MDLPCLLPVLAAQGTEMNLVVPSFPGAHILTWRRTMESNNYQTGLVLQQRCVRRRTNRTGEEGVSQASWERSRLTWFGAWWEEDSG